MLPAGQASAAARTEATPHASADGAAVEFMDPILFAILRAQAAWLVTHDAAKLRRELIALLAALG